MPDTPDEQNAPAAATPHGNAPGPTTARVDIAERPAHAAGSGAAFLALILGDLTVNPDRSATLNTARTNEALV